MLDQDQEADEQAQKQHSGIVVVVAVVAILLAVAFLAYSTLYGKTTDGSSSGNVSVPVEQ